ncbi:MAG: aminotransferase class III-fold pyridoxal phosphate-dependent enzyme [Acidobacteriota bacterium]|nr:aminotransferase class III-fold pyridoxal phosphate-dependent enzyme [Acidobacteriota bacterium]
MESLGLDAEYERAQGDRLWRRIAGASVEVLDVVGGYGACLFGHNHPDLIREAIDVLATNAAILSQGSCRTAAAQLGRSLSERVGDHVVTFTNSGTETVEAAMKHAILERRKPVMWAVKGAFHGKTLGSVQLTSSYAEAFSGYGPAVRFLDPEDPVDWALAAKAAGEVCAAFIEPILGEGGVKPLPRSFCDWLSGICRNEGIVLIADEIQTGMGRTGTFLACTSMGIDPDYVCLSKALGGGIAKIGALLVKRARYREEFSILHSSTFAEDDFSCRVALKALEILDRDGLPARALSTGGYLLARLEELRLRFPGEIREVRGRGLMIGVELHDLSNSRSNSFRVLSSQRYLGYLAASYLLNVHRIRIAPTLSSPFTLRLAPSAYFSHSDADRVVNALAFFCEAVRALDVAPLIGHQLGKAPMPPRDYRAGARCAAPPLETPARVAFVGNFIFPEHAILFDPSLAAFAFDEIAFYLERTARLIGPNLCEAIDVVSAIGGKVSLRFIGLSLTARQIMTAVRGKDASWVMEKISSAAAMARNAGCTVLGLGGQTSIVAMNGFLLRGQKIALTSGNSLTVGTGLRALRRAMAHAGMNGADCRLGVVGANGSIGATVCKMMAPEVAELHLIVRSLDTPTLRTLVRELKAAAPRTRITVSDSLGELKSCTAIVCASNSPDPLLFPEHLARDAVAICDLAVPGDVADSVLEERPEVVVVRSALVRLPETNNFQISGMPLPPGHVFPCMAETLLMGLEGLGTPGLPDRIDPAGVARITQLAEKHGFILAP